MAAGRPGKSSKSLQQAPDCEAVSRRLVVRRIGGWVIYAGAVGTVAACGRTPLGEPFGIGGDDDDDVVTTPIASPSPTGTATPVECPACDLGGGSPTGLTRASVGLNEVAYNGGLKLLICHDAGGYYAMTALCSHSQCDLDIDGVYDPNDLAGGFQCNCHGSRFNGNGQVVNGPALSTLTHFRVSIDGTGNINVDLAGFVDASCRCA